MNRKPSFFEKIGTFISGKGFYFVVLLCVAAIALSGFYLIRGVRAGLTGEAGPVSASDALPDVSRSPAPVASPAASPSAEPDLPVQSLRPTPRPAQTQEPAPVPSPAQTPEPSKTPAPLVFTWPVTGSVVAGYTVETLAYDETMGDWRTHAGLDIAASLGTQVKAAASGTVTSVAEDDFLGTVVTVDHGEGLISVYANLAAAPTVKAGDRVSTGSVLGAVGDTAVSERGRGAHLHFALYRNNAPLDPEELLPER